jgi:hypothetical protein
MLEQFGAQPSDSDIETYNGESIIKVDGNRATATTYCRAYHLKLLIIGYATRRVQFC